jgi:hypothetical protein
MVGHREGTAVAASPGRPIDEIAAPPERASA